MRLVSLVTRPVVALGVALVLVMLAGVSARATSVDTSPEPHKNLAVTIDLASSGVVTVTEHHTWVVEPTSSQNVVRHLPLFAPYSGEMMKKFDYTNFEVSSPESNYDLKVLDNGSELEVRMTKSIDADNKAPALVPGNQELATIEVELSYNIKGVLSTTRIPSGDVVANEFFWSILTNSTVEYSAVAFTINAPAPALENRCLLEPPPVPEGILTLAPTCVEQSTGRTLTYLATPVPNGTLLDARVTFPAGTFNRTAPLTVDWTDAQQEQDAGDSDTQVPFDPTWTENLDEGLAKSSNQLLPLLVALLIAAMIAAAIIFTRRRSDYRFVATDPGLIPPGASSHPVERAPQTLTAVRSHTPPADLSVAEAGAVLTAGLRGKDVTATLIDLAVRRALSITELPAAQGPVTWRITKNSRVADLLLLPHEQALLDALFAHGDEIETVSMHASFALGALDVLRTLGQEIANRELFKQLLEHESIGRQHRKQRTASGRAYLEQVSGFSDFLADPKPEELEQLVARAPITEVFCAYLPWALTCDQADAWARACDAYVSGSGHFQGNTRSEVPWFCLDGAAWNGTFTDLVEHITRLVKTGY